MAYFRDQNRLRVDTDFIRAKATAQNRKPF